MTYTIRKRENVTLYLASDAVELDDDDFKNLEENPYTGNSEEDFLKYISEFNLYDGPPWDLDSECALELEKLGFDVEMKEFDNSAQKCADVWFESGKVDEKYSRYGGFNSTHSTKD